MKYVLNAFLVIGLLSVVNCSSNKAGEGTTATSTSSTSSPVKTATAATDYNGVYSFDAKKWIDVVKQKDPNMAQAPQELLDQMMEGFKAFNITVEGEKATANMGKMVVSGTLEQVSKSGDQVVFKMVPDDEDKKSQPIYITISGNTMQAGPKDMPEQLLFFSKK